MDTPVKSPFPGIAPIPPIRDLDSSTPLLGELFVHRITIRWGDCDPAQIAYTARIPAWGLEAIDAWYKGCLGINWYESNLDYGVGTPFVSVEFQFKSPVTPRSPLDVNVFVARMGNSSIKHVVEGYQDGTLCFTGQTVGAFVDAGTMKPIKIPANMRERINHYTSIQNRDFTS